MTDGRYRVPWGVRVLGWLSDRLAPLRSQPVTDNEFFEVTWMNRCGYYEHPQDNCCCRPRRAHRSGAAHTERRQSAPAELGKLQAELLNLHRAHPVQAMADAAWNMTAQLHIAVHGATWAQPISPEQVWNKLISDVIEMRSALADHRSCIVRDATPDTPMEG